MSDYTELVKALRHCNGPSFLTCRECQYNNDMLSCTYKMLRDAAAAIEEMQAVLKEADKKQEYQHDCICELTAENEELKAEVKRLEPKRGEWNNHEVACLLTEMFGDDCACNLNGIDEWLPQYCEFAETCCPNPGGVACWEQFLKHRAKMDGKEKDDADN